MTYRRRHRWFRRLSLGLAFATVALVGNVSVAAAKYGGEQTSDPYLTDVFVRPGEALGGPDGRSVQPGLGVTQQSSASDVVPQPVLASSGSTFEWNDALTLGIGALVLALGLALALGYLRRPRIAGL